MYTSLKVMATACCATLLATMATSRSSGLYTTSVTRSTPSCGQCHRRSPGAATGFPRIQAVVTPTARSLSPGQSVSVTVQALGGQTASTRGGFAADASGGSFSAGNNSRIQAGGRAITHSNSSTRTWQFGYSAPTNPGLVELYTVVNTVNGDRDDDNGDMWGFHGSDSTSSTSTPVRLFVQTQGVRSLGPGCVGSFGNWPVFGAAQSPTVGNQAFALELHGAAPSSSIVLMVGANPNQQPIDLTAIGATGCRLYVDVAASINSMTSAGNAARGDGRATFPIPLPNNPSIRGQAIQAQTVILDNRNGRPLPVTLTNGLSITFR